MSREPSNESQHMLGAVCPHCQHPNYYDKRVLCKGEIRYRGAGRDTVIVKCQSCGKAMEIKVDCEGYK